MGHKGGYSTRRFEGYVTQMEVWEVRGDTEMNEGRGPMYTVGYFANYEHAVKAGKGVCAMGTDARPERKVVDAVVFKDENGEDKVGLIKEFITVHYEDPNEIRQQALAKLTPKERKILGV